MTMIHMVEHLLLETPHFLRCHVRYEGVWGTDGIIDHSWSRGSQECNSTAHTELRGHDRSMIVCLTKRLRDQWHIMAPRRGPATGRSGVRIYSTLFTASVQVTYCAV